MTVPSDEWTEVLRKHAEWGFKNVRELAAILDGVSRVETLPQLWAMTHSFSIALAADGLGLLEPWAWGVRWGEGERDPDTCRALSKWAAGCLLVARAYLWEENPIELAWGTSLPPHTVNVLDLPHSHLWWVFPFPKTPILHDEARFLADGLLLTTHQWSDGLGLVCVLVGRDEKEMVCLFLDVARHGETYPFTATTDEEASYIPLKNGLYESIAKMLAFIRSPYIPKDRVPPGSWKHRQRMVGIGGPTMEEPGFISLRRPAGTNGGGESWECVRGTPKYRWVASGSNRKVWYGEGKKECRIQWFPPYINGPKGAPLRELPYIVER